MKKKKMGKRDKQKKPNSSNIYLYIFGIKNAKNGMLNDSI